jgi:hypothetical protein
VYLGSVISPLKVTVLLKVAAPENVLDPPTVCVVLRSTKFCVLLPVPPLATGIIPVIPTVAAPDPVGFVTVMFDPAVIEVTILSVIPYPEIVVGLEEIPDHGTVEALIVPPVIVPVFVIVPAFVSVCAAGMVRPALKVAAPLKVFAPPTV